MIGRRYRGKPAPCWAIDGAPVWYTPQAGTRFAAVIDGRPWWTETQRIWLVRLRDVATTLGVRKVAAVEVASLTPRMDEGRT